MSKKKLCKSKDTQCVKKAKYRCKCGLQSNDKKQLCKPKKLKD